MPYQNRTLALIERSKSTKTKALIVADPPEFDNTLPVMMAIVKAMESATRFSVVVAPESHLDQWKGNFEKAFEAVSLA
jgi:hypothetical protein